VTDVGKVKKEGDLDYLIKVFLTKKFYQRNIW